MLPVSFYTLGCKLNQNETEALSDAFGKEGFTVLPWSFLESKKQVLPENRISEAGNSCPLLCIINTCTVTSKAEQKARRVIRLCLRYGCTVLVTGCYAQLEEKAIKKLADDKKSTGTLFVFPGQGKEKLLDLPCYLVDILRISNNEGLPVTKAQLATAIKNFNSEFYLTKTQRHRDSDICEVRSVLCASVPPCEDKREIVSIDCEKNPFSFNPQHFSFHSRAFLKIQDGCDYSCAYCRVPLARGKSISLESQEVLTRLKALEEKGMAEAVLTGVNICQYADPENSSRRFPGLLKFLLDNTKNIAIRLSSIEPNTHCYTPDNTIESEDFFTMLANRRIRPHFHLSVQSGSDSVLTAMGRDYKAQDIVWMVKKLRTVRDDPFIACDIITGFPGETEDDFEQTADLCRTVGFAWIHAFPYSRRPGTMAAAVTKGLVSERIAGERLNLLMDYAKSGKKDYIQRWQGKIVDAVFECASGGDSEKNDFFPFFPALTDNYIKVRCVRHVHGFLNSSYKRIVPGNACRCRIEQIASEIEGGFDAWARLVE